MIAEAMSITCLFECIGVFTMPNIAGRVADITGNMGKSPEMDQKRRDLKQSGSEPETKFELTVQFSGSYSHCRTFDLHWRSFQLYSWCTKGTIT